MTADDATARFGAAEVIEIASKLTLDDTTFLIGGQATNLWAWYYRGKEPELTNNKALTSKDIDYFGSASAARSLASALGGEARIATMDDNTANTATVVATFNGKPLTIDFLNTVIGVSRRELQNGTSVIQVGATVGDKHYKANIALMHPVLCLKSRVANMLHPSLMRRDSIAWQQLEGGCRSCQSLHKRCFD